MSELVAIANLKPGMVIVQITQQNGPVKIRKAGLVSSEAMVQGLMEMGVQEVEIDPEQTVEIATTFHQHTQTQALLRGKHDTAAKADKSLNEQFNRSLFLPTVESLPSTWRWYSRQLWPFALVVVIGLVVGFIGATSPRWWPAVKQTAEVTVGTKASDGEIEQTTPSQSGQQGPVQLTQGQPATGETAANDTTAPSQTLPISSGENTAPLGEIVPTAGPDKTEDDVKQLAQNLSQGREANAPLSSDSQEQTTADTNYEGTVLNEPQDGANVSVSPELMAKFNEAVKALDTQAEEGQDEYKPSVSVHDDIIRVDQLPVRLLTRLPTMNFSAHMYASQPNDRWVRVNGRQLSEGDWIADKVKIVNIEAQRVILSFEGEIFSMAALTDW